MATTQQVIKRHDKFMTANYPRRPLVLAEGKGCQLTDADGNTYLDLFSGFGAGILGHCHEDIVAAGTRQMNRLWHVGNLLHTEPQTLAAEQIAKHAFAGKTFFCHSGSDANEAAFKIARLFGHQDGGKRYKIIATEHAFHGRGFAAMQATGKKAAEGFDPPLPGFAHVPYNDLAAMKQAIDPQTVGIIVEPIQGEGGINVPDDKYLPGLRKLADEHKLLLIFDEVWTGCGRTGKYFGYQHWSAVPDIITLGKAVGCGLAVGAMHVNEKFAGLYDFKKMGRVVNATTLGGNCVSMAVVARLFEVLERDKLVERAAALGEQIISRLEKFAKKNPAVKDVRGRGLHLGIELDPAARGATFKDGAAVVDRCVEAGVLINVTRTNVLRLAPPLILSDEEAEQGLSVLERAIAG